MSPQKVGLALGTGVARGLAHIGVIEVLEQEGIPIDMIAGSSMGALIGGFYAATRDINMIKNLAIEIGQRRLHIFTDLAIPRTGILSWHWVEKRLKGVLGDMTFEDLKIPFACMATDIDTGDDVVLNSGNVWDAVRASATIPVLFSLPEHQGRHLVDGGISVPVPVKLAKTMGADFTIAVNVIPQKAPLEAKDLNLFTIMVKSMYLLIHSTIEASLLGADIIIHPEIESIAYTDFQRAQTCIEKGREAAQKALPEIKRQLSLS